MIFLTIVCMAVITFVNRYAFFITSVHYQPGVKVKRFLSYSSYAVLTSIWMPILFQLDILDDTVQLSHAGIDYLIATGLAAMLTLLKVRSIIVVLLSMSLFFLFKVVCT